MIPSDITTKVGILSSLGVACLPKNNRLGPYEKTKNRKFSTFNEMSPFYVTGFTDVEGCFHLDISNLRGKNWSAAARFMIKLHIADKDILYKIQAFFGGIGSVTFSGNTAR